MKMRRGKKKTKRLISEEIMKAEEFKRLMGKEKSGGDRKAMDTKLCPRCGKKYSYIAKNKVGEQTYLYAVHLVKRGGKTKRVKCYLGPEKGYIYVTRTHEREGLEFKGLLDRSRVAQYMTALISYLERNGILTEEERELARKLQKALSRALMV